MKEVIAWILFAIPISITMGGLMWAPNILMIGVVTAIGLLLMAGCWWLAWVIFEK